jgi:hypothetical protein
LAAVYRLSPKSITFDVAQKLRSSVALRSKKTLAQVHSKGSPAKPLSLLSLSSFFAFFLSCAKFSFELNFHESSLFFNWPCRPCGEGGLFLEFELLLLLRVEADAHAVHRKVAMRELQYVLSITAVAQAFGYFACVFDWALLANLEL